MSSCGEASIQAFHTLAVNFQGYTFYRDDAKNAKFYKVFFALFASLRPKKHADQALRQAASDSGKANLSCRPQSGACADYSSFDYNKAQVAAALAQPKSRGEPR